MKSLMQYILESEEEEKKESSRGFDDFGKHKDVNDFFAGAGSGPEEPGRGPSDDDDDPEEETIDINGLVVIKPGFIEKESEIRERLEEADWEIRGEVTRKLTEEEAECFYESKNKEPYFEDLVEYMSSDESKCLMVWKEEAAKPIDELKNIKEKIRLELSNDEMKNVLHTPDDFDELEKELNIFMADPAEEDDDDEDEEGPEEDDEEQEKEPEDSEDEDEEDEDDNVDDEPDEMPRHREKKEPGFESHGPGKDKRR